MSIRRAASSAIVVAWFGMVATSARAAPPNPACADISDEKPIGEGKFGATLSARSFVRDPVRELPPPRDPDDDANEKKVTVVLTPLERGLALATSTGQEHVDLTLLRTVDGGGHCVVNTWREYFELPASFDLKVSGRWQSADRVFLLLRVDGDFNEHGNDGGPIHEWKLLGSDGKKLWVAREDTNGKGAWRLVPAGEGVELTLDKKGKKRARLDAGRVKFK